MMDKVKTFLNSYKSKNTKRCYRMGLEAFFKSVYGKAGDLDAQAEQYFSEKRDIEEDIEAFLMSISGLAPKSVRLKITSVKMLLIENDVELPQKFWRKLKRRIKGNRALTLDKVPSNVELRKIVMHMPIHGKGFYLTLASSGMRIGELLQIKLEDLEWDSTPCKINIRGEYTKTGNSRVAFISKEARETIEEWLKVRDQYVKAAKGKSHFYKKLAEDDRVFPFETGVAYMVWHNALEKTGMSERDKSTNRRKLHPHVLRKFFRTRLGSVIPVDVVEALMGHEGYLTEVYRRYSMEDLAKFYLQGESALLVFTEAGEVTRLRQEVEESKEQLQTLVNTLTMKSMKLEEENKDLNSRIEQTNRKLSTIENAVVESKKMVSELEKKLAELQADS